MLSHFYRIRDQLLLNEDDALHLKKESARQLILHQRVFNPHLDSSAKKLIKTLHEANDKMIESLVVSWMPGYLSGSFCYWSKTKSVKDPLHLLQPRRSIHYNHPFLSPTY